MIQIAGIQPQDTEMVDGVKGSLPRVLTEGHEKWMSHSIWARQLAAKDTKKPFLPSRLTG